MASITRSSQTGSLVNATSQAVVKEQMAAIVDALKMIGAGNANFKPLSPDAEASLLNTRYAIYVNKDIGSDDVVFGNYNADRQQLNQELECGYSPFRPFKTFARAAAEVARRSILAGPSNDIYNRAAIFYDIGEDQIYNGLGSASVSAWNEGSVTQQQLQALNDSATPGIILPRGVSVIGRVLRNSVLRPSYVPSGSSNAVTNRAAIFRATGGSFFFNFTFQDKIGVTTSHHLVHSHEFCDQADLIAYYDKIMTIFGLTGAEVVNPGETEIVAPAPDGTASESVDTTVGSSPYIFNCSIRSDYGMCGPVIDGRSVTGFRSMEAANFSIISLQTDYANAFQKYSSGNWVNVESYADYLSTNINDLRLKTAGDLDWATGTYETDYRHHGFKLIGKAFVQEVSEFTIGAGVHHWIASGSDGDLSGCNAAFGGTATLAHGFSGIGEAGGAFPQDTGFLGVGLKRPLRLVEDGTNLRRITLGQVATSNGYVTDGTGTYLKLATPLTEASLASLGISLSENHYIWVANTNRNVGPGADTETPENSVAIDVRAQLAATPWSAAYPDRIYVKANANNNILSNGLTLAELALNTIYVRRLVDTRSPSEREYSLIVSNTNISATRQPPAGFVLRLANRSTAAGQLDPSNGVHEVFVVDSAIKTTVDSPVADTSYYAVILRPGDSVETHSASKCYLPGTPISRNNRVLKAIRKIAPSAFNAADWTEANRDIRGSRGIAHPRSGIAPRITLDKDLSNDPDSLTLGINQATDTDFLAQLSAASDYLACLKFLEALGYNTAATILLPQASEEARMFNPAASASPTPSGKLTSKAAWPLEFNKPSIIEAGGTIFRYIGRFNYTKALPKYQVTTLTDQHKIDAAVTSICGGATYADGSIENGLRLEGNRLIDLASGRDTSIETAGIGGLSDPEIAGPAVESRDFRFEGDVEIEQSLTVGGTTDLSGLRIRNGLIEYEYPTHTAKTGNNNAKLGVVRLASIADLTKTGADALELTAGSDAALESDPSVVTLPGLNRWRQAQRLVSTSTDDLVLYVKAGSTDRNLEQMLDAPPTEVANAVPTLTRAAQYANAVIGGSNQTAVICIAPGLYDPQSTWECNVRFEAFNATLAARQYASNSTGSTTTANNYFGRREAEAVPDYGDIVNAVNFWAFQLMLRGSAISGGELQIECRPRKMIFMRGLDFVGGFHFLGLAETIKIIKNHESSGSTVPIQVSRSSLFIGEDQSFVAPGVGDLATDTNTNVDTLLSAVRSGNSRSGVYEAYTQGALLAVRSLETDQVIIRDCVFGPGLPSRKESLGGNREPMISVETAAVITMRNLYIIGKTQITSAGSGITNNLPNANQAHYGNTAVSTPWTWRQTYHTFIGAGTTRFEVIKLDIGGASFVVTDATKAESRSYYKDLSPNSGKLLPNHIQLLTNSGLTATNTDDGPFFDQFIHAPAGLILQNSWPDTREGTDTIGTRRQGFLGRFGSPGYASVNGSPNPVKTRALLCGNFGIRQPETGFLLSFNQGSAANGGRSFLQRAGIAQTDAQSAGRVTFDSTNATDPGEAFPNGNNPVINTDAAGDANLNVGVRSYKLGIDVTSAITIPSANIVA